MHNDQRHHFRQSQNPPLCWTNVQERLFHQGTDDQIRDPVGFEQGMGQKLAHFTELFSLRKAYGNNRAANSGFTSAAHIHDHASTHSIITDNTESELTRDLYIESLEESLAAARGKYALDTTTRTPVPPTSDPLTLLQEALAEQRKQVLEIMAQNAKLIATLSKGGSGNSGGCHKP
jgi:hypothetical protein